MHRRHHEPPNANRISIMMKKYLASAIILAAAATAAQAEVYYMGRILWTDKSGTCDPNNSPNIGDHSRALFHPKGVTGNLPFSSLNRYFDNGIDGSSFSGHFNSTLQVVDNRSVGADPYNPSAWLPNPGITKVSVETPNVSNLNPPPPTIVLTGKIENPWGDPGANGCVMDYVFNGVKN
jgi:hypothetical protein